MGLFFENVMKLQFLSRLRAFISAHLLMLTTCLMIFLGLVTVFLFINYTRYKLSSEFAFKQLQTAIASSNASDLAHSVNVRALADHLAHETARTFPFFHAGPTQIRDISSLFQGEFLRVLKTKPDSSPDALITDPVELNAKPVYILPPDIIPQLIQNLVMTPKDDETALIETSFDHPLLKEKFPILLSLKSTKDGWIVQDILNAHEIVSQFREIFEKRIRDIRDRAIKKSTDVIKEMAQTLEIQSCTANIGLLSDQKTALCVVEIKAHNKTKLTVKNVNAEVDILNRSKQGVLTRRLNSTQQTPPNGDFSHRWIIELEGRSHEGQKMLKGAPLNCTASWRTLTLSNSRVLHTDEIPRPLANCIEHTDPHIEGLCKLGIFQDKSAAPK